jgi:glutathione S-transferase
MHGTMNQPLRLYDYAASPNCYKVRLALAELELDYERVPIDIFGGDTLTEDFAAKNPGLTTPVLEIGDGNYLPESNAILLYLAEGSELLPEHRFALAQVHRWLFFEQARIVPFVGGLRFQIGTGRIAPDSEAAARQRKVATGIVAVLAAHLAERDYLVGDAYTLADLCLYGYTHAASDAGIDLSAFPRIEAWLDRVRTRPRHVADLAGFPANAQVGQSKSVYDLFDL